METLGLRTPRSGAGGGVEERLWGSVSSSEDWHYGPPSECNVVMGYKPSGVFSISCAALCAARRRTEPSLSHSCMRIKSSIFS